MQTECFFPCLTTFENEPFDRGKVILNTEKLVGGVLFWFVCF